MEFVPLFVQTVVWKELMNEPPDSLLSLHPGTSLPIRQFGESPIELATEPDPLHRMPALGYLCCKQPEALQGQSERETLPLHNKQF